MSTASMTPFTLTRNPFGHLILTDAAGQTFDKVAPIRAFPILDPEVGIAIVATDGQEVAWIDKLSDVSPAIRQLVEEELATREFMPQITRIVNVSTFATPSTWEVETDRGATSFVLRGEEDLRRIGADSLLVSDTHGVHFLIRELAQLDKHSRRILDRFL